MADPRELSPAELVARGLLAPGPLAPAITSKDPEKNMQAIRELVNPSRIIPDPEMINPVRALGAVHNFFGQGLGHGFGALNALNPANQLLSPEQRALRSRQLGNQVRDMGEAFMMPLASAGRVIGPLAQEARPLFTAFLTRLAQSSTLAGGQQAMMGKDAGTIFGHAAFGAALQGAFEAPAKIIRTLLSSKAGTRILADAAAKFKTTLASFQARQQFDAEFVGQLNELRAQGFKEDAARASNEYAQKAFGHKVEGQKLVADWEQQVMAQQALEEAAKKAHSAGVAERIATAWDARVPAWEGMPRTTEGLIDRIYGQGKAKMSAAFDTSLKEVLEKATGKTIPLSKDAAEALGIAGVTSGPRGSGPSPGIGGLIGDGSNMAIVDAQEVAKTLLGNKGKFDPELYHEVANALSDAGLGNAKANTEYAAGMALRKFMDKTQALEYIGEPTLYVEKMLKGLTQEPKLVQLQRRIPEEDAVRGTIAAAREGLPTPLPEIPKPIQPPLGPPPPKEVAPLPIKTDPALAPSEAPTMPDPAEFGVTAGQGPSWQKLAALGAGVAGPIGGKLGGYGGYAAGTAGGTIFGLLLSKLLSGPTVRGPITPAAESILSRLPGIATGIIRSVAGGGEMSAEDLAKMDAEIAARSGQTDPRLQLDLGPANAEEYR